MAPANGLDAALRELAEWLEQKGRSAASMQPLRGDVSARHYVRVELEGGATAIAAIYPESIQDACRRFLVSTRLLQEARVPVPQILDSDCARGLMLLEDIGGETVYERAVREPWNVSRWFHQAMRIADDIATVPVDAARELNPPLDGRLLRAELERTWNVFAHERTPSGLVEPVHALFDTLCAQIESDALRPCHRDFMVRNLVPRPETDEIVVLDHQDLRLGPRYYDVASLLNDSLFPPPALAAALLDDRLTTREDELLYHRTAAQRTLKAVGTYAAAAAKGQEQHLPLLRPTLRRALDHLERIPEGQDLAARLRSAWITPADSGERAGESDAER